MERGIYYIRELHDHVGTHYLLCTALRYVCMESVLSQKADKALDNDSVGNFDDFSSLDGGSPKRGLSPTLEAAEPSDLESQPFIEEKVHSQPQLPAAEYEIDVRKKLLYLSIYFTLNLTLTIYNKALLDGFAFPWLLTAIHCGFVTVGCYFLMLQGWFNLTELDNTQNLMLIAFSLLFTLNIAMSNVSLALVSVPFHQIMRSTTPAFAILIYRVVYSRVYSTPTYLSLIPIIAGVGLATYGDYYFTVSGFLLTLLGVVLAAGKTIVSNRIMTGNLALSALEILLRMSPLAAMQSLLYSLMTGESARFYGFVAEGHLSVGMVLALAGNGFIAFLLNVSSFQTNKLAGALTITVAGNLKQCLTILLGIALFDVKVGFLNGLGMLMTVLGAAYYSKVELDLKRKQIR